MSESIIKFQQLNARISTLVAEKVVAVQGTPEERTLMRVITESGIEAADNMLDLINKGLTYPIWKANMATLNDINGPMALFENEHGDIAKILKEFIDSDFEEVYNIFLADGTLSEVGVRKDLALLKDRLAWIENVWSEEDALDAKTKILQDIGRNDTE